MKDTKWVVYTDDVIRASAAGRGIRPEPHMRACFVGPCCLLCTGKMWTLWDEKINGDSETKNWMAINTKPCPKCTKPVEKNGGCNLVVCTCGQVRC